jgi:hypothetical protein
LPGPRFENVNGEDIHVVPLVDACKLVPDGEEAVTVIEPFGVVQEVGLVAVTLGMVNGGRTL